MKEISMTTLRKMTVSKINEITPAAVISDGDLVFYVVDKDDVIVVGDLHIRVRNSLRAQEKRARMGMPPAEKLHIGDVKGEEPDIEES